MRRDLMALVLVLCTIGLMVALLHRFQAPNALQTAFSFGMTSRYADNFSDAVLETARPRPVAMASYSIDMQPAGPVVRWTAQFQKIGRVADPSYVINMPRKYDGTIPAAEYQAFLEGFFKAGGQGRDTVSSGAPSRPGGWGSDLADGGDSTWGLPRLMELADDGHPADVPDPAYIHRNPVAEKPRAHSDITVERVRGDSGRRVLVEDAVQEAYWYQFEARGRKQRYSLTPFSADGRQVLAYLQTTVVFRTWHQLQTSTSSQSAP